MQLSIMEFMKKNFFHVNPNTSFTIADLSTTSSVSGAPTKKPKLDTLEWNAFKNRMNEFPGLTWEFSEPSTSVDFVDMTITINKSNKIETTLFEKSSTYISTPPPPPPPPHSSHPPGLLPGIVAAHCSKFLPVVLLKTMNKGFFSNI